MKSHFSLDPEVTYLNSGSISISPTSVLEAVQRYQRDCERNPSANLFMARSRIWEVQEDLAAFFHADPKCLFFRNNVTGAMNAFILGIPLPKSGEILVSDLEYGAVVNICRLRAEREGLKLRKFSLPGSPEKMKKLTKESLVQTILHELKDDTRMLLLSHVMTANGLTLPLDELAKETRKRGIILVVDGAHGPGSVDVDFRKFQDVDFYGGNLHKWMMAPKGTGFGWVNPRHHESLKVIEAGWTTFEVMPHFADFADGNPFTLRMFDATSYDFAPFFAVQDTLAFWRELGPLKIQDRLKELQGYTESKMAEHIGWELCSPPAGPLRGPLLTFALPKKLADLNFQFMFELLQEHRLQVMTNHFQDCWHLRLSPHIYNDEGDIDRAIEVLKKYAD